MIINKWLKNKNFKSCDPKITIKRIEDGFRKLNTNFRYEQRPDLVIEWEKLNLFSWDFYIDWIWFGTSWKWITKDYTKASAMAEWVERFSDNIHYIGKIYTAWKFKYIKEWNELIQKLANQQNFKWYINESENYFIENKLNYLSFKEILKEKIKYLKKDNKEFNHWVDWYSLLKNKKIKIPLMLIKRISKANWLASWNIKEEAIVQASFEIFERHVLLEVFKNKKIIPTIKTNSIKNKSIINYINILKKSWIDIIIKDFSLWWTFPCIWVVFIDKNLKNSKNEIHRKYLYESLRIGTSFNLEEALTRCFTEYIQFQGRIINGNTNNLIWDFFVDFGKTYESNNKLFGLFRRYDFDWNKTFLYKGNEINFKSLSFKKNLYFKEDLEQIKEICNKINSELLVVDLTHKILDFPVYRVIMPGISDILWYLDEKETLDTLNLSNQELEYWSYYWFLNDFLKDSSWINDEEKIKKLIDDLKNLTFTFPNSLKDFKTKWLYTQRISVMKILFFLWIKIKSEELIFKIINLIIKNWELFEKTEFINFKILLEKKWIDFFIKNYLEDPEVLSCKKNIFGWYNPFTDFCWNPCNKKCPLIFEKKLYDILKTFF
ncbi:MAG: Cytoplasmic protein [uncultured bacterium (gcode 4)]|uniref:Cytoplasmic protein n=1 Tax=uncultured bacterium (gcode 4) TaxID=1234023 RepID=K2GU29_9BACT|nr:MAG: Cytoplasmic protein [uncultured bacterium (gcode 4)]